MKKRSAILTIGTCAVAALIGTAGAAHANPTYTVYVHKVGSTADAGNMRYYQNLGSGSDEFTVADLAADGYGVRGSLLSAGGTVLKSSYNGRGANNDANYFQYDLARGKDYVIKACLVSGESDTTPVKCASKVVTG